MIERYVDLASYYHWKNIFAIGNFEMFITRLGMAAEKDFIHERLKKGKTATGLFTTDDEYSQDFAQVGQKELRTSVINTDVDMGEKWINVLPDIDTTAFFQADDLGLKMTLVKSKDISDAQTALFQNLWKQSRK